ncbi:MAG: NUDIX domain-containing protein [bacterium]|nr:NUDIX domain-containing protein [bacterium]
MKEETKKTEQTEQTEQIFSPEVWAQFKKVKTEFSRNIAPKVREGVYFWPNSAKKARKQKRSRKNNGFNCFVKLPPLAAILSRDSLALQAAAQAVTHTREIFPVKSVTVSNKVTVEKGKIVSVFVILEFQMESGILKYHLQKIAKKSRPGFPGGEIKENESILEAGVREVKEETSPDENSIDISKFNPIEVAKFTLKGAVNGERGVILFAKLPESEIDKIRPGGGDKEEDELVAHVYLATAEQIEILIARGEILPNSQNIWQIFKDFRKGK